MESQIAFSVLDSLADIEAISDEWDQLLEKSICDRAFSSSTWYINRCRCFSVTPQLVLGRRCDELVGIFPLIVEPLIKSGKTRLGFADPYLADYQDIIVASGDTTAAQQLMKFTFERGTSDQGFWFSNFRKDSNFLNALSPVLEEIDIDYKLDLAGACPFASLSQGWEYFLKEKSSNFRQKLKSDFRKIEAAGLSTKLLDPEDELVESIADVFLSLHLDRKADRETKTVFTENNAQDFVRKAFPVLIRKKSLRIHALCDGSAIVGILVEAVGAKSVGSNQSGFRPDLAAAGLSPGKVLLLEAVRKACEDGFEEYDFLRGRDSYKLRLGTAERKIFAVTLRKK